MRIPDARLALLLMATACDPGGSQPAVAGAAQTGRDPAASAIDFPALQGYWRVVGVAIADGRVQAYGPNDPAYMGQRLTIAGAEVRWDKSTAATPATLDEVCRGAATMRLQGPAATAATTGLAQALKTLGVARPDPHEVACLDGGNWGGSEGGAVLFPIDHDSVAMRWYDNVVIKLRRDPR